MFTVREQPAHNSDTYVQTHCISKLACSNQIAIPAQSYFALLPKNQLTKRLRYQHKAIFDNNPKYYRLICQRSIAVLLPAWKVLELPSQGME